MGDVNYLRELTSNEQIKFVEDLMKTGKHLEDECTKYGYSYFDLSRGYNDQHEKALKYLTE